MNRVFTKSTAVIESCISPQQLDVALKFVGNAGIRGLINYDEWDILFRACCEKLTKLSGVQ